MVCFFPNGKKGILFSFTKRAISRAIKTVAQFLYLRFVVKYLRELFLTKCLTISSLINSYLNTSPVSNPVIPVSTNCCQLPIKFLYRLIRKQKLEVFFQAYLKLFVHELKQDNNFGELCHILSDFLSKTKQRHGTNGQNWSLTCVHAGVPQESILGLLSFLIYINILSDSLTSNVKLFVDDTSLFSVVHDENISPKELK